MQLPQEGAEFDAAVASLLVAEARAMAGQVQEQGGSLRPYLKPSLKETRVDAVAAGRIVRCICL